MTTLKKSGAALLALALTGSLAACSQAPADPPALTGNAWSVDSDASELSYVSVKAGEIAEANTFENVTGSVTAEGGATIEVDLSSVSTGVDIRDERMRDIFFVVANNPSATVTAQVDPAAFEALGVGESLDTTLDGTLSLAGVDAPFQAEVSVTRAGPDRVIAVTDKPVIIDAGRFELTDELAQLQELAGLPSITPAVPVSFSIAFER
ncbi:MAG: YceI family protein [Pseudomonadota bacterium]